MSVIKLFVGQIPKNLDEDGVREVFQEFGEIVEVIVLRDRRSGAHQGCAFVKLIGMPAAQAAIAALHNQRALPPLRNPLQVRLADSAFNGSSERGRTNVNNKLFVGGVPQDYGEHELRMLFSTYGELLDVHVLVSKYGTHEGQRGCAFVRYTTQQACAIAIEALHGKYSMKAGELPLVVRYADPPKIRRGAGASHPAWPQAMPPPPPPPPAYVQATWPGAFNQPQWMNAGAGGAAAAPFVEMAGHTHSLPKLGHPGVPHDPQGAPMVSPPPAPGGVIGDSYWAKQPDASSWHGDSLPPAQPAAAERAPSAAGLDSAGNLSALGRTYPQDALSQMLDQRPTSGGETAVHPSLYGGSHHDGGDEGQTRVSELLAAVGLE